MLLVDLVGRRGERPARLRQSGRRDRAVARPAGAGDIGIGGAARAGEAARLGLIDEFRCVVYPVLVGGGIPFYRQCERRLDLELIESRTFGSRGVYMRYRVVR
jgi:dihydrofolate reductase